MKLLWHPLFLFLSCRADSELFLKNLEHLVYLRILILVDILNPLKTDLCRSDITVQIIYMVEDFSHIIYSFLKPLCLNHVRFT